MWYTGCGLTNHPNNCSIQASWFPTQIWTYSYYHKNSRNNNAYTHNSRIETSLWKKYLTWAVHFCSACKYVQVVTGVTIHVTCTQETKIFLQKMMGCRDEKSTETRHHSEWKNNEFYTHFYIPQAIYDVTKILRGM